MAKEVKAIFQPFMVNKVLDALQTLPDVPGAILSDVVVYGRQCSCEPRRDPEDNDGFLSAVSMKKLEIIVPDEVAERVRECIASSAQTGNPGDGAVFITAIDDCTRIAPGGCGGIHCRDSS